MRCYFIGGSLDGTIKEIDSPSGRYRVPVLTHNTAMVLASDGDATWNLRKDALRSGG